MDPELEKPQPSTIHKMLLHWADSEKTAAGEKLYGMKELMYCCFHDEVVVVGNLLERDYVVVGSVGDCKTVVVGMLMVVGLVHSDDSGVVEVVGMKLERLCAVVVGYRAKRFGRRRHLPFDFADGIDFVGVGEPDL